MLNKKSVSVIVASILLLAGGLIIFSPVPKAAGTTRYVSLTGNDITGTGTVSNPYKTLRKAVNMSLDGAGDTIVMRGGTYTQPGWEGGGSLYIRKNRLTIRNYPNEKVVIDGSLTVPSVHCGMVMLYSGATQYTNITFYGLNFSNAPYTAIQADAYPDQHACNDITISYCEFFNITQNAIYWYNELGTPTIYIERLNINNCTFTRIQNNASMGECISLSGCRDFTYENNTLREFTKQGLCMAHGSCYGTVKDNTFINKYYFSLKIDPNSGGTRNCHHINISKNLFIGEAHNSITQIFLNPEEDNGKIDNVSIWDNIFNLSSIGSYSDNGITFTTETDNYGIIFDRVIITYNTIYTKDYSNSRCFKINEINSKIMNCVFANNILITGAHGNQVYFSDLPKSQTNVTFKNNFYYYTNGATLGTAFSDDSSEFEEGAISSINPLFYTLGSDFHLQSTSSAIDNASALYTVAADYDSNLRPQGDGYDIGAFEYVSDYVPPVIPSTDENDTDNDTSLDNLDVTILDFVEGSITSADLFYVEILDNMTESTTLSIPSVYIGKSWWFFTEQKTVTSVIVYGITQTFSFEPIPTTGTFSSLQLVVDDISYYRALVIVPNPGYFQTSFWWFTHLNSATQLS